MRSTRALTAQLNYDVVYPAAVGGSIVALYFALVDVLQGQAFHTPSLLGGVLWFGARATDVVVVRLDVVAALAVVHVVAFLGLGLVLAHVERRVGLHDKPVVMLGLFCFALMSLGFLGTASLAPGLVGVMGVGHLVAAHALAAVGMSAALIHGHPLMVLSRRRLASSGPVRGPR